jgi:pyruvate-formate lyase-activating enzyme
MELLKTTRTLDPRDGRPVPARVLRDGPDVFLEAEGATERVQIERDAELYRLLMPTRRRAVVSHLVVEPTYRCDQECPFCFTHAQGADLTLAEIASGLAGQSGRYVSISGGEPTLRDDLPEIIRLVERRNTALLATNGLRLTDRAYLDELRRAGLRHVVFSFNGFSERAQLATNGRVELERKLRALENLVEADTRLVLSMLVVRGANEGEIGRVLELAARHPRQIKEVRLRAAAPVGRHAGPLVPMFPSELLALLCEQAGLDPLGVRRELGFYRWLGDRLPLVQVMQKSCSFSLFLLRERGSSRTSSLGSLRGRDLPRLLELSPVGALLRRRLWPHEEGLLKVSVRVWPTLATLDLEDHHDRCASRYAAGPKRGLPVCVANLLHDFRSRAG